MSFEQQLEFVQGLASPPYLSYLAQTGRLVDPRLVNYLDHLRSIWTRPEYSRFISYPASFHHLELLKSASFRDALLYQEVIDRLIANLLNEEAKAPVQVDTIIKQEDVS